MIKVMIEVAVSESEEEEYPKLMINTDYNRIVLFTSYKSGMQMNDASNGSYCKGHYSEGWAPELFEPFHGSITLENLT